MKVYLNQCSINIYFIQLKKNVSTNIVRYLKRRYKAKLNYSYDCIDFINKLIITNPKERIGYKNVNELKNHNWFKGFNWNKLKKKLIESPFKFINSSIINQSFCPKFEKSEILINIYKYNSKILKFKKMLKYYDFINMKIINNKNI